MLTNRHLLSTDISGLPTSQSAWKKRDVPVSAQSAVSLAFFYLARTSRLEKGHFRDMAVDSVPYFPQGSDTTVTRWLRRHPQKELGDIFLFWTTKTRPDSVSSISQKQFLFQPWPQLSHVKDEIALEKHKKQDRKINGLLGTHCKVECQTRELIPAPTSACR